MSAKEKDRRELLASLTAAVNGGLAGGLAGYVQRIRNGFAGTPGHMPKLTYRGTYGGCICGDLGCGRDLLMLHIENLRLSYELKVEDLASETNRRSDVRADAVGAVQDVWQRVAAKVDEEPTA